jgi:anti-sigma-K factor RskA
MSKKKSKKAAKAGFLGLASERQMEDLIDAVNNLNTEVAAINEELSELQSTVTSVQGEPAEITTINATLATMQATFKTNNLVARVAALEAAVFPPPAPTPVPPVVPTPIPPPASKK